ncbi:MAG: hypothetical protein JRH13_14860 [Deltaproteobacteria bacterium]|nr:hypothetical protein [Deltaproteobacteria bacterium]MBW2130631.1 hypothetical protein [Deltaproteobacteria bacterium]MBW2304525.1 hypothetical protein [Deltaproteobacteria bacterium]
MEKINDDYAALGLRALKRAAEKVAENARKDGSKIPIWRNGRIEYIIPEIDTEQVAAVDRRPAAPSAGRPTASEL